MRLLLFLEVMFLWPCGLIYKNIEREGIFVT